MCKSTKVREVYYSLFQKVFNILNSEDYKDLDYTYCVVETQGVF